MAVIPPTPTSGQIYLLNVPWDSNYKNVVDFKNDDERHEYMVTRIVNTKTGIPRELSYTDCQYSRRDGVLKVPVEIDQLYDCNYVMYKNPYYSNKWFYCFVIGQRYINDNCTELRIKTDVYSTWIDDAEIMDSFVEREHVNDDTPGKNLIPEGLETGEFIAYQTHTPKSWVTAGQTTIEFNPFDPVVCLAYKGDKLKNNGGVTPIPDSYRYSSSYNGIPTCVPFLLTDNAHVGGLIKQINDAGDGPQIFTVFAVPKLAVAQKYIESTRNLPGENYSVLDRDNYAFLSQNYYQDKLCVFNIDKPTKNGDYEPRNKKLLTYPYCYLGFTAPNGTPHIYRYENFNSWYIQFDGVCEINPSPSLVIIPQNYLIPDNNLLESVTVTGYPNISYVNDYYNTWMAQNSQIVNLTVDRTKFNYDQAQARNSIAQNREMTNAVSNMISATVGGTAAALTSNIPGAVNNAAGSMTSAVNSAYNMQELALDAAANSANYQYDIKAINAQIEKQSMLPDTVALSSSNATLLGYNLFSSACFADFCIKPEYAKKIDDYFDMYGYQVNEVKKPNLTGRQLWNYVKTINVNISGKKPHHPHSTIPAKIPTADLNELRSIFDNGVTIWHDVTEIYNYNAMNRIKES